MFKFIKETNEGVTGHVRQPHTKIEVTVNDQHASLGVIIEEFKTFLLGCGYHPNCIDQYLDVE